MNPLLRHHSRSLKTLAAVALLVLCFVGLWLILRRRDQAPVVVEPEIASAEITASFYASLAALDVEENERAATLLREAVAAETDEPALWANLAVSQLRLNQPNEARESLENALQGAPDSRDLALLTAELYKLSGDVEQAIDAFRKVHAEWPENVAVTFSLVSLLGQLTSDAAEAERLTLLTDILQRQPGNVRALIEAARVAATLQRKDALTEAIEQLQQTQEDLPEDVRQQLSQAQQAASKSDFRQAALSMTFFENLMKPLPEYQRSLERLGMTSLGSIGTPLRSFVRLTVAPAEVAAADTQITFELQHKYETAARPEFVLALEHPGERRSTLLSLSDGKLLVDESAALPFPGASLARRAECIAVADLNSDFHQDLICVGTHGCRIFLGSADNTYQPLEFSMAELDRPWRAVWAVDVDAEGDMDLLLSDGESLLRWVRNNGDATFTPMEQFLPVHGVTSLCDVDLDQDGDIDLVTLDASGSVLIWQNQRGGSYDASPLPAKTLRVAIAVGDIDRDGQFDMVTVDRQGNVRAAQWLDQQWTESTLFTWQSDSLQSPSNAGDAFLAIADIDNNGGVDVTVGSAAETSIWLRDADSTWRHFSDTPLIRVNSLVDWNEDGLLDLVGLAIDGECLAINRGQAGYGWQVLRPLASTGAGDKRINSFGIGGTITVRAGNLVQGSAIESPRVHFGLGVHSQADVALISWPNGTSQAEFELQSRTSIAAIQRLKGSCPWVFAFDGNKFQFVKDFLWRSPLGLKINAQSTAGIMQTEDWIKIRNDQLKAVDQRYQIRITAELWETHFFDHVSLLAVDHSPEFEVYLDERFVPNEAPAQEPVTLTRPEALEGLTDERGENLDDVLRDNDGVFADGFALGEFQGVAEEHWIEFSLPEKALADRDIRLVGHGWIYPTDSSLNVAIDQGEVARPFGLVLDQLHADGTWHVLRDGLGFPSGKNKDVLLKIPEKTLELSRRFRLRTNMEVYWDSLRWGYAVIGSDTQVTPLGSVTSELRYRGYSQLLPLHRRRPDTPVYEVESTAPKWLDLEGYYTRFGDVSELLADIDDRYVIVNAGDELLLEFDAGETPPKEMQRDFILIGDGWVKDGDFNTAHSQSVRPLPSHSDPDYDGPLVPLSDDAVYQRSSQDWHAFHTRYVTPRHLHQSLWRQKSPHTQRELP